MQMGKRASKFRPSEMISDAIVMVGAENLTANLATVKVKPDQPCRWPRPCSNIIIEHDYDSNFSLLFLLVCLVGCFCLFAFFFS